ncbi:hypothetical protein SAMN04487775_107162 [Treponema bryantii]|uniref:Uncharacterized protein n=1 Tax=Treponema bryantii TaxID=163 RepID=A0A1I3LSP9_9SPIR|nr:hypothetical protein [Treponema bryantii]SFI87570.1 hypothetical protein SAMN04487775_107162 [Treponema bryantii]
MSFVDKAYKEVLEQLKKEGKEFIFYIEKDNTGDYKKSALEYTVNYQEDFHFPEEILEQNSIPDIINAFKNYYIGNNKILDNSENIFVAKSQSYYSRGVLQEATPFDDPEDDLEDIDEFDDEYRKDYPGCAKIALELINESKSKEEVLKDLEQALQDYLKAPEKTVSEFIITKKNELNLKPADIYKPVLMTRQNYSKIISNYTKHPKFEACIQLAFGLKLNLEDTTELLRRAGNAFSDDLYDRVIMYFIEHQRYNMFELNECLYKLGENPIGSFKMH